MLEWINQNKEWLFSGVIATAVFSVIGWVISARHAKKSGTTITGDTYSAGRDINISKGSSKTTNIKNFTIGVVGDNAKIKNLNVK